MKPSKYRAVPTVVADLRFASKREAARYSELRLLEKAGEIANLELQPRYRLGVNGQKICDYIADFRYLDGGEHGKLTVEDCKGFKTPVFRLKAKLFEAIYGIELRIT